MRVEQKVNCCCAMINKSLLDYEQAVYPLSVIPLRFNPGVSPPACSHPVRCVHETLPYEMGYEKPGCLIFMRLRGEGGVGGGVWNMEEEASK